MSSRSPVESRKRPAQHPASQGVVPDGMPLPLDARPRPVEGDLPLPLDDSLRGARILVVDDEPTMREVVGQMVQDGGAEAVSVGSGEAALDLLRNADFDLVILDVGLPGISGFDTLRSIRERSDIPVMIVTGAGSLDERVTGFDLGADDYVVKPVEIPELSRRARALLRRARAKGGQTVEQLEGPDGLVLRLRSHEALVGDSPLDLTPKEFALLRLLLDHRGNVVRLDELSLAIWGYGTFGSRNFVEAHVSRLRAKLAQHGVEHALKTVRGEGYVIR
ncbi:MAG: response regulator transcription factor [Chloroflexi bacterium]|nr:response regulator transcription factor [Chloroflexota bacterium]